MERFLTEPDKYIAYADDVWILRRKATAIQEVVTQITEAAVSSGLVINERTTKYMKINKNISNLLQYMIRNGQVFEGV
jgi:hypothetical protein